MSFVRGHGAIWVAVLSIATVTTSAWGDGSGGAQFPKGRWEYVNTAKATEAKKVADQFPENKLRPEGAQGGLFGIGRYIMPGDKDYNRRSLSGK